MIMLFLGSNNENNVILCENAENGVCMCVHACVRVCMRACVRARVRACEHVPLGQVLNLHLMTIFSSGIC